MQILKPLLLTLNYIHFYNILWFFENIEPQNVSINPFFYYIVFNFTFFQAQSHNDTFKRKEKNKSIDIFKLNAF